MNETARNKGRTLALILAIAAVVLGIAAVLVDVVQNDGFDATPLILTTLGLVVIRSIRKQRAGS